MSQFWVDNFWASDYWVDNFWLGLTSGTTPVEVQSRINYHPEYVRKKRRPKDESILNAVQDLVAKLESAPIQAPAKVKQKVKRVVKKAEAVAVIQDVERQSNELQATMLEIDKLQTIIVEHTLKAQKDEADAINALLNII